jgi:hypothetical protein
MNAYLCTYRRKTPSPLERRQTETAAKKDALLHAFLEGYNNSYYDWGDDPSFFAAHHLLGDVHKASWGVCRPDVRDRLREDDLVVFFCGCQDKVEQVWRYYFIGFGTVRSCVERPTLWKDPAYAPYRKFYNVIARYDSGHPVQNETFHQYHKDWERRAKAPYVLFDPVQSAFNLESPHHVATWKSNTATPEIWKSDPRTKRIERLLFTERGISRRLRTGRSGYGHAKLNLLIGVGAPFNRVAVRRNLGKLSGNSCEISHYSLCSSIYEMKYLEPWDEWSGFRKQSCARDRRSSIRRRARSPVSMLCL